MPSNGNSTFPAQLPASDRARWHEMTASQRRKAADRIEAFEAWSAGKMNIDQAVKAAGLSSSRFYRLAAEWRSSPSLSGLGAFAGAGAAAKTRLDPDAINALQAVVADVVRLNAGASVSHLVNQMV